MDQSSDGLGAQFPGHEAFGEAAAGPSDARAARGGVRAPAAARPQGAGPPPADPPAPSLQAALRRARAESAEQAEAVGDLRSAEQARLDLLRERLIPVLAEIPVDCDLFDLALTPGEHARLFVDMIAFVEMARDRRTYRFQQDTRHGRILIAESAGLEAMTRAVADYVARRLVEREKALAADALYRSGAQPAPAAPAGQAVFAPAAVAGPQPARPQAPAPAPLEAAARAMRAVGAAQPPRPRPQALRVFARGFAFLIEVLGSAAFFGLLAAAGYWAWLHFAPH